MEGRLFVVIVNPIAGVGFKIRLESTLRKAFEKTPHEFFITYTKRSGHAGELVRLALQMGAYAVIAVGGDGTINEIASEVSKTSLKMGILPMGSGNGLARSLGIPMSTPKALDLILQDSLRIIDCGLANLRPFFCTFGVGFDAEVTKKYEDLHFRGIMSYVLSSLDTYIKYKPVLYRITIENETFEQSAFLIACANADQYGNNAYIAPDAEVDDGLLDLVIVRNVSLTESPIFALQLFTKRISQNTSIDVYRASKFVIERSSPGAAHIDGESVMMDSRIELGVQEKCLSVFAPVNS